MTALPFLGGQFEIADRIGLMPLMRFAKIAKSGADSADMDSLAAMYDLVEQCLDPADWERFCDHATAQRADDEQIMAFVGDVIKVLTERPIGRRSGSSPGAPTTPPTSVDDFSLRAQRRLEEAGRADLAVAVLRAREARTG